MSVNVFAQNTDDILRLLKYYNAVFSVSQLQELKSTYAQILKNC